MSRRLQYRITAETAGMTIRKFLEEELRFSGHQISRLKFQAEGICVDGEKAYVSHVLSEGEVLTVGLTAQVLRRETEGGKPAKIWEAPAPSLTAFPLRVLYEDEDYLIVDKPAGLVCHPSPGHYSDTLANQAAAHLGGTGTAMDMRVTGRLDRETSGIVTFARSTEAAAMIHRQRDSGRLAKTYLALAEGIFDNAEGMVDEPLRREAPGSHRMVCAPDGKPARTFYKVIGEAQGPDGSPRTLLSVRIEHGRTHQIRVHMAHIGHPLVGDPLYGAEARPAAGEVPQPGAGVRPTAGCAPQAGAEVRPAAGDVPQTGATPAAWREPMGLHAYKLSFDQPFKGIPIEITAQIPAWAGTFTNNT